MTKLCFIVWLGETSTHITLSVFVDAFFVFVKWCMKMKNIKNLLEKELL